jgi:hypothetical protein
MPNFELWYSCRKWAIYIYIYTYMYIYKCQTIGRIAPPTSPASPFIRGSSLFEKTDYICDHLSMLANGGTEVISTLS